jgi:hypothetical protein
VELVSGFCHELDFTTYGVYKTKITQKFGYIYGNSHYPLLARAVKPLLFPLLLRGGKPSGIPLFTRVGRGCCLIYILVKNSLLPYFSIKGQELWIYGIYEHAV